MDKIWYRCVLVDLDNGREFPLGIYRATTQSEAETRAKNKYKNLFGRLETNKTAMRVTRSDDPAPKLPPKDRRRLRDVTPDIFA